MGQIGIRSSYIIFWGRCNRSNLLPLIQYFVLGAAVSNKPVVATFIFHSRGLFDIKKASTVLLSVPGPLRVIRLAATHFIVCSRSRSSRSNRLLRILYSVPVAARSGCRWYCGCSEGRTPDEPNSIFLSAAAHSDFKVSDFNISSTFCNLYSTYISETGCIIISRKFWRHVLKLPMKE